MTTVLTSDWWTGAGAARAQQREGQAGGVQRADLAGAQRAGGHGLQGRASTDKVANLHKQISHPLGGPMAMYCHPNFISIYRGLMPVYCSV